MIVEEGLGPTTGDEDVCRIAQELIRIDTTNFGAGKAVGEAKAAEYAVSLLSEVGIPADTYEAAPGRANVVARWPGKDPSLPALMLHGHLDVVPAEPAEWSVDPFAGVIRDGMLWGRGAVDMKNMIAMILAAVRGMVRRGERPNRDVVVAFFADEEDNFALGSSWMVDNYPQLFQGVGVAITECGGYSIEVDGKRVFLIQTGEKGMLWLRLRATGRAGHGSLLNGETAISRLAEVVSRIQRESWPIEMTASSEALLSVLREITGLPADASPESVLKLTGAHAPGLMAGMQNVANVTMFDAGYLHCVIPSSASAFLDIRPLPGRRHEVFERIRQLVGHDIEIEIVDDVDGFEADVQGFLVDTMTRAIRSVCPDAAVAPYLCSGATDNTSLRRLGIQGYGFAPMLLPSDFNLMELFHGHDERVPLDALVFGESVLEELLRSY